MWSSLADCIFWLYIIVYSLGLVSVETMNQAAVLYWKSNTLFSTSIVRYKPLERMRDYEYIKTKNKSTNRQWISFIDSFLLIIEQLLSFAILRHDNIDFVKQLIQKLILKFTPVPE